MTKPARISRTVRAAIELAALSIVMGCSNATGNKDSAPVGESPALPGTGWVLTELAAGGADYSDSTLSFEPDGRVSGSGGCNRYNGGVEIAAQTIRFGAIAATRRMCDVAIMEQEQKFFEALENSRSWRLAGEKLTLLDESGEELARLLKLGSAAL